MTEKKKRRPRDPAATREAILDAAFVLLAKNGAENLALTEVVRLAGVHRATAYQHFKTREELVKAAAERFSDKFYKAVLGETGMPDQPRPNASGIIELNERLANFVMENPELCRIWLFEVLSSSDPAKDRFWKEYEGSYNRFSKTDLAQPKMDSEVMSVLILAGAILWPVWARAHAKGGAERRRLAQRFTDQLLRLSMYGSLKPEQFPDLAAHLVKLDSEEKSKG